MRLSQSVHQHQYIPVHLMLPLYLTHISYEQEHNYLPNQTAIQTKEPSSKLKRICIVTKNISSKQQYCQLISSLDMIDVSHKLSVKEALFAPFVATQIKQQCNSR